MGLHELRNETGTVEINLQISNREWVVHVLSWRLEGSEDLDYMSDKRGKVSHR